MRKISIICASARSPELTQRVCNAWHDMNRGVEIQFVVPSPGFQIERAVNFVDDMKGCSHANAQGYNYCTGDYIAWLSDETMPTLNCLEVIANQVDAQPEFMPYLAEFSLRMVEEPGSRTKNFYVCGRQYCRFGMAKRQTLDRIGGFFDPTYHAHWVDSDLSLRCWEAGGRVETCFGATIDCISYSDKLYLDNSKNYFDLDFKYFLSKWRSKYPQMNDPNWRAWNYFREFQ